MQIMDGWTANKNLTVPQDNILRDLAVAETLLIGNVFLPFHVYPMPPPFFRIHRKVHSREGYD